MEVKVEETINCSGHQELRDIVIETRNDVKHILSELEKGEIRMKNHETRINALESKNDQQTGADRQIAKTAGIVAGVISLVGVIVSIIVSFWRVH